MVVVFVIVAACRRLSSGAGEVHGLAVLVARVIAAGAMVLGAVILGG